MIIFFHTSDEGFMWILFNIIQILINDKTSSLNISHNKTEIMEIDVVKIHELQLLFYSLRPQLIFGATL